MIGDLRDLTINVAASIVLILLGSLVRVFLTMWQTRAERKLWLRFRGDAELAICLTTRDGPLSRSTPRVSLAEVLAVAEVTPLLQQLKIRHRIFGSMDVRESDLASRNLLILGSTFVNDVSRRVVALLGPTLPASVIENPRAVVISDRRYTPRYSIGSDAAGDEQSGDRVVEDFALVIRARNPYDKSRTRWMFLVMGCHGFGTAGAAHLLIDRALSNRATSASIRGGSFAAILSVKVVGDAYVTSILEIYALPEA